jgi:hypothetical protein
MCGQARHFAAVAASRSVRSRGTLLADVRGMRTFESGCTALVKPSDDPHGAPPDAPAIYWHRDLPPLDAKVIAEHELEAVSVRVPGTMKHRDELWQRCYRDLMRQTVSRLGQEVTRLHGRYAHVLKESIDSRHDDATGERWLHGRFTYTLLR